MLTAHEMMESLYEMFGQPLIKYIHKSRMDEGTSIREHVLDMMVHTNFTEMNKVIINESMTGKKKTKISKFDSFVLETCSVE